MKDLAGVILAVYVFFLIGVAMAALLFAAVVGLVLLAEHLFG